MNRRNPQATLNLTLLLGASLIGLVSLAHAPGVAAGFMYLGPVMFAVLVLWLGHYPGERLLAALAAPYRRRRVQQGARERRGFCICMPRGAGLLACALAGRAPPVRPSLGREATFRSPSTFAIKPRALDDRPAATSITFRRYRRK